MCYLPGHGQLGAIKHYLKDLTRQNITDLGLVLGLWLPTIGDRPDFLNHVMSQWLNQVDNVASKGKPSWRSLVQGLRNEQVRQNGIANEIAEDHHTQGMFALLQCICTSHGLRPLSFILFCLYTESYYV